MSDLKLILTPHGTATLVEGEREKIVWSSDDDDTFLSEFGGDFINEDDADEIIEYLLDQGVINDREADDLPQYVFVETLDEPRDVTPEKDEPAF